MFIDLKNEHSTFDDLPNDIEDNNEITKDVLDNGEYDMINENDNASKPIFNVFDHINIVNCRAYYVENNTGENTKVAEKQKIVQWRGQHFKCKVTISLDNCVPNNDWTIGLVQACDGMALENQFGNDGMYQWEFHPLKTKKYKTINDSNGSQWPFYSHRTSMLDLIKGRPLSEKFYEFKFSDYFYPTMHWEVNYMKRPSYLTEIQRRQSFLIWFVAIQRGKSQKIGGAYSRYEHFVPRTDTIYVLKTMRWRYNIKLKFDALRELGKRCVSIDDVQEEQPIIFDTIEEVPTSAMVAPNCNSCQSLSWYPFDKQKELILRKEPDDIIVPWNEWTKDMTVGYNSFRGFEKPDPPPRFFEHHKTDPLLSIIANKK